MVSPTPGTPEWHDLIVEDVIEPELEIVDPHHHLWPPGDVFPYGPAELTADLDSGHRIVATVFMECGAGYRPDGPDHLRSLGETDYVASVAAGAEPRISGIVAHVDLTRDDVDDLLDAHADASGGLLRGIRDALSRAEHPEALMIPGRAAAGKYQDPAFRRGVARLGDRGLSYDTWHYHYQNRELLELARAVPDTVMVLDHFGTPLGVGPYAHQREEIFADWCGDIAELATCENVVAKLGGLAMPDNGFGWNLAERPPTSAEFLDAQGRYYRHMIECFGPERCMFESNFPVDRLSLSYRILWNALKILTAEMSPGERTALFSGTARRIYRL
jgi:L-fuconolactonase